jgi:hypothetical protein
MSPEFWLTTVVVVATPRRAFALTYVALAARLAVERR